MKNLLKILLAFFTLPIFGQGNIFTIDKTIVYFVEYTFNNLTINDTIRIITTGRPWQVDPTKQKEIIIKYNLANLDTSVFRGFSTIGWLNSDTTGAIDDGTLCWFHPPRNNQYKLLELAPFPRIEYPLAIDKTYSRVLNIGDGWGDISNMRIVFTYKIINYTENHWVISSQAIPDKTPTNINKLDFTFSETEGFTTLIYTFSDGTRIKMTKKQ